GHAAFGGATQYRLQAFWHRSELTENLTTHASCPNAGVLHRSVWQRAGHVRQRLARVHPSRRARRVGRGRPGAACSLLSRGAMGAARRDRCPRLSASMSSGYRSQRWVLNTANPIEPLLGCLRRTLQRAVARRRAPNSEKPALRLLADSRPIARSPAKSG